MTGVPPGVRLPSLLHPAGDATSPAGLREPLEGVVQTLWQLPKVELHLHLEGALRADTVRALACAHEPDSPLCHAGWPESYWSFRDLAGFVAQFGYVLRTCIRGADDYYRVAAECFQDLAAQHVVYAEVSVGPRLPGHPHYVSLADTVAAIDQARREVEARGPLRVGLIVGLSRNHLTAHASGARVPALEMVCEAMQARDGGAAVVGIDLHGDEQAVPDVEPFVLAFRTAAEAGLGLRAHAGEAADATAVWQSLRRLRVQRIAHGVRATADPALVRHLAQSRVPLDVCPTSNVLTGAVPSLRSHPIRALHEAGVVVTVSSDDPLPFSTAITAELALLHHCLGFSLRELGELTAQAAAHAFLPAAARAALESSLRDAWRGVAA